MIFSSGSPTLIIIISIIFVLIVFLFIKNIMKELAEIKESPVKAPKPEYEIKLGDVHGEEEIEAAVVAAAYYYLKNK